MSPMLRLNGCSVQKSTTSILSRLQRFSSIFTGADGSGGAAHQTESTDSSKQNSIRAGFLQTKMKTCGQRIEGHEVVSLGCRMKRVLNLKLLCCTLLPMTTMLVNS